MTRIPPRWHSAALALISFLVALFAGVALFGDEVPSSLRVAVIGQGLDLASMIAVMESCRSACTELNPIFGDYVGSDELGERLVGYAIAAALKAGLVWLASRTQSVWDDRLVGWIGLGGAAMNVYTWSQME